MVFCFGFIALGTTELHVAKAILELTGVRKDALEFQVFLLYLWNYRHVLLSSA